MGAKPRRASTWNHMPQVFQGRLQSWQHKSISLGGRIVLPNSVSSSILIFCLSFIKMLVVVWKEVAKLERDFIWGGWRGSFGDEENLMV